jgi:putative NADH-flavin reductase
MKIALIGATGFVGIAILKEALDRRHQVTAIVRHPDKLMDSKDHLVKVKADVLETEHLAELLKGHDVVVSAYNAGWSNPDIYNDYLKGAQSIQRAVRESGVRRFIVVGGAGSLFIAPDLQLVDSTEFPNEWKPGALAARDYLNIIKEEKELEWTFLSPAIEMNQGSPHERKGTYRTNLDQPVFDEDKRSFITVEDLAVAIVDEAENPQHIRQRFTVGY